jgi:hypothetical protein
MRRIDLPQVVGGEDQNLLMYNTFANVTNIRQSATSRSSNLGRPGPVRTATQQEAGHDCPRVDEPTGRSIGILTRRILPHAQPPTV